MKKNKFLSTLTLNVFLKVSFILLVVGLFNLNIPLVLAKAFDLNNGVPVMNQIFSDLGVDKAELKNSIQTLNYSRRKKMVPEVSLTFAPLNATNGEKITAMATPVYFLNSAKNLYYTWFLKSKDCDRNNHPNAKERKKCDLNGDGRIDINDYKIKAMRIIANNGFDWSLPGVYNKDIDNDGYRAHYGGDDQAGKNEYCYVHNTKSGDDRQIGCGHLFPHPIGKVTGDDSFGLTEEKFWHTDPKSADTAGLGNVDEANVAGLGVNKFTWNYETGDEVGVAVEGISMDTTQTNDSSYKIMWALPKKMCDNIRNISDLNQCLYDNLVSPSESGAQGNRLKVNLTYSPKIPINDSSGDKNGDELVVYSSIQTAGDDSFLHYFWQVYQSNEANPQDWGSPLTKAALLDSSKTTGIGLKTFKFKLNFPHPKKYLRVKLTVIDKKMGGIVRRGHSDIVISINSSSSQIRVYPVEIQGNSLKLKMKNTEMCKNDSDKIICPVVKNEIIGIQIPKGNFTDFRWIINGKPFTYQKCFFDGCQEDKQTNKAYFPVLGNVGKHYVVNLLATDQATGDKINLSKTFVVVDPKIKISSADENACKPIVLGEYIGLKGKKYKDRSKINFQAKAGKKVKLKITPTGFFPSVDKYVWFVDGQIVNQATAEVLGFSIDSKGILTIPSKKEGENYDVSASVLYSQGNLVKRALNKYWGVSYNQFYEKPISDTITIKVVNPNNFALMSQENNKKIIANIYSALPAYISFLLKLVLTAFVLLIGSGFVLKLVLKEK